MIRQGLKNLPKLLYFDLLGVGVIDLEHSDGRPEACRGKKWRRQPRTVVLPRTLTKSMWFIKRWRRLSQPINRSVPTLQHNRFFDRGGACSRPEKRELTRLFTTNLDTSRDTGLAEYDIKNSYPLYFSLIFRACCLYSYLLISPFFNRSLSCLIFFFIRLA
jgi:hypothetical protein